MDEATKQFIQGENEKLATMVAGGFAEVHEKIAEVHEKVDRGFAEVNTRLERIEQSLEIHRTDIDRNTDDMRLVKTTLKIA